MFESIANFIHENFYVKADPRVRDKFLMGNPLPILAFVIFYLLISKYLPGFMRKRGKICDVKYPLTVFNFYVTVMSIYILVKMVKYMIWSNYDFQCMPLDLSSRNETLEMIDAKHTMILFKMTYIVETIIFFMTGRFKLVQLYMIYHHASLPLLGWFAINFYPGGHAIFFVFVNMATHSVMFTYLTLMQLIPKLKELNWQPFITFLNIMQIVAIFVHGIQPLFYNPCEYPLILVIVFALWGVSIMVVFLLTWPFLTKRRVQQIESEKDTEIDIEVTQETMSNYEQNLNNVQLLSNEKLIKPKK